MNMEWAIYQNDEIYTLKKILLGNKSVVVTGGYYDPLHLGHIRLIRDAKQFGKHLIVLVNSDNATRKKKGYCLIPEMDRAFIIVHLNMVNSVLIVDDNDMTNTLKILCPNVYCKGGDRLPNNMNQLEVDVCEEIGCEIKYGVGGYHKQGSSSEFFKEAVKEWQAREKS